MIKLINKTSYDIHTKNNLIIKKNWAKDHLRDQSQRNYIMNGIKEFDDEDWIIISDIDEIPNPKNFSIFNPKKKFAFFQQKLFYYKFNLLNTTPLE